MRLEYQNHDGVGILRLYGRFVLGSEAALMTAEKYLNEAGLDKAILDLQAVPYMDSTGLAFVVELHKMLVNRGGQLLLARANDRVSEVLEMTRISEVIPSFKDVEDAEANLRGEVLC